MEALVYSRPGLVEVRDIDPPTGSNSDVILEVLATGICGSELEGASKSSSFRIPPLVMGHEIVGRLPGTEELVAVNPLIFCGECDLCVAGRTNVCRKRRLIGVHAPGGFAPLVAVPPSRCRPVPKGIEASRAVLAEPMANGLHAVRLAERQLGGTPRSLGVIGAGMLGIASALAAIRAGVPEVTLVDLNRDRLALAAKTLDVRAVTKLDRELDAVIDAVGLAATRAAAVHRLRPGGVSVWIGLNDSDPGFESLALVRHERMVQGSYAYLDSEFDDALELCRHADASWVEAVGLSDSASRFTELMESPGPVPKTVIVPRPYRPVPEAISDALP
jgi:threonine dehydrogenase-like Zn-dependent dehydrogenase